MIASVRRPRTGDLAKARARKLLADIGDDNPTVERVLRVAKHLEEYADAQWRGVNESLARALA